jgi:heat-inducible transcriptional repressor
VASQALVVEGRFAWAPATFRQTMLELEDMGLLEQPHAASGRVPTDRGYRLFVDALIGPALPDEEERSAIDRALAASTRDVEELLQQASRVLAELSTQVGFAVAPNMDEGELTGIELIGVGERRVHLVLSLHGGLVRSMTFELTSHLSRGELDRVGRLLRERLLGLPFAEVRRRLAGDEALVRDSAAALVAARLTELFERGSRPGVFFGGAAQVARQPEFRQAEQLRPVLELLEHPEPWRDLVGGEDRPGLSISIGREHNRPELAHLSLVSFRLEGSFEASIGLLGPRRMDYARAIGLVEFVGRRLSSLV